MATKNSREGTNIAKLVKEGDRFLTGREVRTIGQNGDQIGVIPFKKALELAREARLDLVLVAGKTDPPVCRIINFGKLLYEQKKREKEQRRHQQAHKLKEIKFHVNIEKHDYEYKINHAVEFVKKGYKVKITLIFRGRELAHKEFGLDILNRVIKDLEDYGLPENEPRLFGKNMVVFFLPK